MEKFKKVQVVLLPTENKANALWSYKERRLYSNEDANFNGKDYTTYYHLYFLSDDEKEDGDWCYKEGIGVFQCKEKPNVQKSWGKKIIASTDKLPLNNCSTPWTLEHKYVPQPSQDFIDDYVKAHNDGKIISEVLVEYENHKMQSTANHKGNYDYRCPNCKSCDEDLMFSKQPTYCFKCSKLKIDSDNIINIKSAKENYSKEDLFKIAEYFYGMGMSRGRGNLEDRTDCNQYRINKYIDENL